MSVVTAGSRQATWDDEGDANCSLGPAPARHHGWVLLQAPAPSALRSELRWGFLLHTYAFACLFFLLAFYAFFSILNLRSLISSRPFMSTINGFLCLLGASRAGCLFIDPYALKETLPRVLGSVLWDVGFPCLTSAFCLVQLTFLQLTQLKLGPEKLRKKSCLSLIITAHFSFVIGTDIVVAFHEQLLVVKHLVETVFLAWGALLCCLFLYGGYRVMALLRSMPGSLLQRQPAEAQHKGIMQLAMLAPYKNLAGSVAAAFMPTMLTAQARGAGAGDRSFSFRSERTSPPPQEWSALADGAGCSSPGGPRRQGSPDPRRRPPRLAAAPPSLSPGGRRPSRRDSDTAALADIAEDEAGISLVSPTASGLAAKRARRPPPPGAGEPDEEGAEARLLPRAAPHADGKSSDLTLHSILNHIAYVNKAAIDSGGEGGDPDAKSQVRAVLNVTYTTAAMGLLLCVANGARLYGPYGMLARSVDASAGHSGADSELLPEERPRPWPWFLFQTLCRALEFAMGCAMANITKQPVHGRRAQQYAYSLRLKHRESLYI
ncbi:uncharacterized protein LOC134536202 isoform X2 [Bacillus rossius redtenbacheri]|uniref:uncharacterized protein LOC134536202 isoform X2 n=1 Tax=Bacillus rossius redtenbacheri TaxID=93214 RepID=UPI002FDEAECE